MTTLSFILVVISAISILLNFLQSSKITSLVEESQNLRDAKDAAIKDKELGLNNLNERLQESLNISEIFQRKFLFTLAVLSNINKSWKSRLTFYNPEAITPTIMMKYNENTQSYIISKIGSKEPLELESGFKFADKKVDKIIEALRTDIGNKTLQENGGFVEGVIECVKLL